jgi:hypothetical protein
LPTSNNYQDQYQDQYLSLYLNHALPLCNQYQNRQGQQRGVSHCHLAIYITNHLNAKEELRKFQYFTMLKYNLRKKSSKETKSLQDIITLL